MRSYRLQACSKLIARCKQESVRKTYIASVFQGIAINSAADGRESNGAGSNTVGNC